MNTKQRFVFSIIFIIFFSFVSFSHAAVPGDIVDCNGPYTYSWKILGDYAAYTIGDCDVYSLGNCTSNGYINTCSDSTVTYLRYAGTATCAQVFVQKSAECGGDEFVLNWDDVACTGDCLIPCEQEFIDKSAECGGDQYVLNWETEFCTGDCDTCARAEDELIASCGAAGVKIWDSIACFGECNCDPVVINSAESTCAPYGGLAYFDNDLCIPICMNCVASEPSCEYGVTFYDYDTCEYECDGCLVRSNDCLFECSFECSTISGMIYSDCTCPDDPDPDPEDPDPEDPDPPDVVDPDEPDPGPEPDGENDNALLGAIEKNTHATALEVDRVGDILEIELPKLNANVQDVENLIGVSNDYLDDIKDNTHDITVEQKKGNDYLKNIEENTSDTAVNTGHVNETLGDIKDILDENKLEQSEVDSQIADAETDIQTRWDSAVTTMNNFITLEIDQLEPVGESDINPFVSVILSMLPAEQTCVDLDLSWNEHELIIGCDFSVIAKELLAYFVYISTILIIFAMVHRELRPNS